jgi:hypothetical protein
MVLSGVQVPFEPQVPEQQVPVTPPPHALLSAMQWATCAHCLLTQLRLQQSVLTLQLSPAFLHMTCDERQMCVVGSQLLEQQSLSLAQDELMRPHEVEHTCWFGSQYPEQQPLLSMQVSPSSPHAGRSVLPPSSTAASPLVMSWLPLPLPLWE